MTADAAHADRVDLSRSRSGQCPDLTASRRGRDDVSSAATAGRQPQPAPPTRGATPALDTAGSGPLPRPSDIASAQSCPLLTARAVADLLDVCAETVLRWIRHGELPAIRLPGGAVRIIESELQAWLRARATPARGVLATTTGAADCERYPLRYD